MSDEVSMPDDIVEFAEQLIEGEPGALEFLKIHEFKDDFEAHDDEFQERKYGEFVSIYTALLEKLSAKFGNATLAETEDEFEIVPLNGVTPAAIWEIDGTVLYLAISHEDRETPILLAIGTA